MSDRAHRALAVAAAALTGGVAVAQSSSSIVPTPNVVLDRDHIVLSGSAGDTLTASFSIDNRASCGATLIKTRASKKGITVDCMKWTLAADDATTCTVTVVKEGLAPWKDRFLFAASVAEDCKPPALAIVEDRRQRELKPLEDELAKLTRATLDDPQADAVKREKALEEAYKTALADNDRALAAAMQKAKDDKQMLADVWKEASAEQQKRIEKQRLKVQMLPSDDSAMKALDTTIAETRRKAQSEVDALKSKRATACREISTLSDERDKVISELRAGQWHNLCKKSKSEIERIHGISLAAHLAQEGGEMVPVPQSVIDARTAEWNKRIDAQRKTCDQLADQERAAQQRGIDAIKALEAKRPQIKKAKDQVIEKARAELDILDTQSRNALLSQRQREQKVDTTLNQRREQLKEARAEIEKKYTSDKVALRKAIEKSEDERRAKIHSLHERIGKLRGELGILENSIRNAHNTKQNLGVLIDATFR